MASYILSIRLIFWHFWQCAELSVWDHPFKTSANFHDFWLLPPTVGSFLLLSIGKFGQFLTSPPPKKCRRLTWMVPIALLRHYFGQKPSYVFHHTLCLSNFKAYAIRLHFIQSESFYLGKFLSSDCHFLCFLPNMTHWIGLEKLLK